ncbi:MAG: beta-N-acetylhexosaminidase [Bdellovibrionales bacterium]|nr:beta-N-acetylhexosaminidase [Bdellovibrionales bacterium]
MAKRSEIERKLGQMFVTGIPGTEMSPETREFLADYQPGGVIYFAHNYDAPALLWEYSEAIRATMQIPVIVAVDHEGGKVQRFLRPFTHFPEPAVFGEIDSPKLAFEAAVVMARELRAVGVNLDFHPLCDIHTRPSNPVIGRRAFGTTEEIVGKMASAMVRGFMAEGMISCIKHFPGHGDTTVDSHLELPKSEESWEQLLDRELKPFIKCIKSRVDMIMTAHILNRALDPKYPVTLSREILTGRLRGELRFQRLIITDDMLMDAVAKYWGKEEMILLAIEAGADILLYRDIESGREAMDTALRFLSQGKIKPEWVEAAHARIMEVKERVLMPRKPEPIEGVRIIGCPEHRQVLDRVLEQKRR